MATIGDNFQPLAPDFPMTDGSFKVVRAVALDTAGAMDALMSTETGNSGITFDPDRDWLVFETAPEALSSAPYVKPVQPLLDEAFDGTTLPTTLAYAGTSGAATVSGGLLHLTPGASARWNTEAPFTGRTATVFGVSSTGGTYARLRVRDTLSTANLVIVGVTTTTLTVWVNATATNYSYNPTAQPHIRIREKSGTVYIETASDPAGAWTTVQSLSTPAWMNTNNTQVEPNAYGGTGEGRFDRFQVMPAVA